MTLKISNTKRVSIFHTPKVCGFMFDIQFCLKLLLPTMIFKKEKISKDIKLLSKWSNSASKEINHSSQLGIDGFLTKLDIKLELLWFGCIKNGSLICDRNFEGHNQSQHTVI